MFFREIERLRGYAVTLTVVAHTSSSILPIWLRCTWAGVDLFFVISGFVVTLSLLRILPEYSVGMPFLKRLEVSRTSLKIFFTRRAFRIIPLALVVAALTLLFDRLSGRGIGGDLEEILAIVSGIYNYSFSSFSHPTEMRLGVYWTLTIEEHFYVILPLMFIAAATAQKRVVLAASVMALIILIVRPASFAAVNESTRVLHPFLQTHNRLDSLMAGVILAVLRNTWGAAVARPSRFFKWLCVLLMLQMWIMPGIFSDNLKQVPTLFFVSLWFGACVLVYLASTNVGHILDFPFLGRFSEFVGSRSYPIYLSHLLAYWNSQLIWQWMFRQDLVRQMPTSVALGSRIALLVIVTLAFAEILHRLIELPFIRMGKRYIDERLQAEPTKLLSFSQKASPNLPKERVASHEEKRRVS